MEKKTQLIIGGALVGALAIGGVALALQGGLSNSPKDQFIKRMTEFTTAKKVGGKYEVSFEELDMGDNPYASFFEDIKISGESHTDGTDLDLTVELGEFFGQDLPSAHFIYADKKGYINAELLPEFASLYTGFTGGASTSQVSDDYADKFIGIEKFIELTSGKEEADKFQKEMDSSLKHQTAFQKEIQTATADYLKKVEDENYSADDDKLVLVLKKDDVKGFVQTVLTTMANSENYEGDRDSLKESLNDFDKQYDETVGKFEKFEIRIALDKKNYDSQYNVKIEESDLPLKLDIKFENAEVDYKAPKAPSKSDVLSEKEIDKLIDEIGYEEKPVVPDFKATDN